MLDNGIHIAQMMSFEEMDNCLDLITVNGAKTMNISDTYGIEAGKPANFIVVDARSEFEAVCEEPMLLQVSVMVNICLKKDTRFALLRFELIYGVDKKKKYRETNEYVSM